MTNYLHWKVQQDKLSAFLHLLARGRWEGAGNGREEREAMVGCMVVNQETSHFDICAEDPSREDRTQERRYGIPHCSDPVTSSYDHQ